MEAGSGNNGPTPSEACRGGGRDWAWPRAEKGSQTGLRSPGGRAAGASRGGRGSPSSSPCLRPALCPPNRDPKILSVLTFPF